MKKTTLAASACLIAALTGCAAPSGPGGPGGGNQPTSDNSTTAIRCGSMALGGAVLGGLLGGKKGALKGAAVGLAACAVVEVASRRTSSSADVERTYRTANRNALPPKAKIVAYTTAVTPQGVARTMEPIKVQSTIRAVSGTGEPVREVKEVLIAYGPDGEEFKRGEKIVNDKGGSGEFDNSFTLRLPEGAPEGVYKLRTQLYLNGAMASTNEGALQVFRGGKVALLPRDGAIVTLASR